MRDNELKPSPHRPKSKNIGVTTKVTPIFLVEVAGKRGIKQLVAVFDDAPEQNKEYQKRSIRA